MAEKVAEKKDWVTPVALVSGAALLGVGAYLVLKKPSVIRPGDKIQAVFAFKYTGTGGDYAFQVSFGEQIFDTGIFDHVPNLVFPFDVHLSEAKSYSIPLLITLPVGIGAGKYDCEAIIATPPLHANIFTGQYDYLVKHYLNNGLTVVAP